MPSTPLRCAGATSPRYVGTTTHTPPPAMPESTRPPTSSPSRVWHGDQPPESGQSGRTEAASRREPTTKTTVFHSRKVLRPQRSASCADELHPTIAPRQKMHTTKAQMLSLVGSGTVSLSGVSATGGTLSVARMATADVFMLPQLYPCISDERSTTQTDCTSGRLRRPSM